MNRRSKLDPYKTEIINKYQNGISLYALCKEFNVSQCGITNFLKNHNIVIRSNKNKKYSFNEHFFDEPNEINMYWLGFISGDGNVAFNQKDYRYVLTIGLDKQDKSHLLKFKNIINFGGPLYKQRDDFRIQIYSKYIANILINKYNILPRKTFILDAPTNITNENDVRSYLRGLFDSDGTICIDKNKKLTLRFLGTKNLLEFVREQLFQYIQHINKKIIVKPHKSIFELTFCGKQIITICNWLYKNSTDLSRLDRKFKKFILIQDLLSKQNTTLHGAFRIHDNRYRSLLVFNGIKYHLGCFPTELKAAQAYDKKAKELGLLDRLNFKE